MIKLNSLLTLCFIVLLAFTAKAQRLSDNPEEFIVQLQEVMQKTNKPDAMQIGKDFKTLWDGGAFSATQKPKIVDFSKKMIAKKMRPAVDMRDFYQSLIHAVNIQKMDASSLDNLLDVSNKVMAKYQPREVLVYIDRLKSFLGKNALYYSDYNKLYADGRPYQFVFVDETTNKKTGWFTGFEPKIDTTGTNLENMPQIAGACILFENTNLSIVTPFDSVTLTNTKGAYVLSTDDFIGKKGQFTWGVAGLSPTDVYVDFSDYAFKVKVPRLKANNVMLTYKGKFTKPAKGNFEFFSQKRKNEKIAEYPIFKSYDNNINLGNVGKNITYRGGFSLEGQKIYSTSARDSLSYITIKKNDEVVFRAHSKKFALIDSMITADKAGFAFYLGAGDSLYHPSVKMSYDKRTSSVKLFKNKTNQETPFIDQYHKMYISADMADYNIDKEIIDFYILGAKDKIPATFESYNYFNEKRFEDMQGIYNFHPLKVATDFSKKFGNPFYVDGLADQYKQNGATMKGAMTALAQQGYVTYEPETGLVTVLNRTTHNDISSIYVRTIDKKNKKQKIPKDLEYAVNHDYDDMLIESLNPRVVLKDTVLSDTTRFEFKKDQIYLGKVADENVTFTERTYTKEVEDVTKKGKIIKKKETIKITEPIYFEKIDIKKLDETYTKADHLKGYYTRSRGKVAKDTVLANATLSKSDNGLLIRGVQKFMISKVLNVNIIPRNKEVTIFGERAIYMAQGEITAGNFRFIGKNFFLDYQNFSLEMPEIDTMLFYLKDEKDTTKMVELGAEIRLTSGQLQINNSNNKSGLKKGLINPPAKDSYEAYPKLKVADGGTIYFDQPFRQNGTYNRAMAKFKIPSIDLDSLNSLSPDFQGTFESNIFPAFKERLIPMSDNSLGFIHNPPKSGYKIYGLDASMKFDNKLIMDKKGLFAPGEIKHFTTTLQSKQFIFTPDSLIADKVQAIVQEGTVKGIRFPKAEVEDAKLVWYTRIDSVAVDSMSITTQQKLFALYDKNEPITLRGTGAVTPSGLWGDGFLTRNDFQVNSRAIKLDIGKFSATESEFFVNSIKGDPYKADNSFYLENPPVLQGNFVNVNFDLVKGVAKVAPVQFIADSDPSFKFITFPYAQYGTSIREADWEVKNKVIRMNGDSTSYFSSTKFGQGAYDERDLVFKANKGLYDIDKLTLALDGIPYINSADAKIIPDQGKAIILKGANLQDFTKAKVIIDTLNGYHNLFDGTIKINSRLDFEGDATYQYININKDTFNIKFNKFELVREEVPAQSKNEKPKVNIYTVSNGEVTAEDKFYITSRILYKGKVTMYANKKDLSVDGFIKLDLKSRTGYDNWIPYKRDAGDVLVNVPEKLQLGNDILTSGLHFDQTELTLYSTFLSPKKKNIDGDIFLAGGILTYNPAINEFKVAPEGKREGKIYEGNMLIFDDSKATVDLEGKFNLVDPIAAKYVQTSGYAEVKMNENDYQLNTMFAFNFPSPSGAFDVMATRLLQAKELGGFSPANTDKDKLMYKLAFLLGDKPVKEYMQKAATGNIPLVNVDKRLQTSLVLSHVDLKWSEANKAFYSVGRIGVSHIYNRDINMMLDGAVEIIKNPNGDIINVYIEQAADNWYFFSFQQNILAGVASEPAFNQAMAKGKRKKPGEYSFENIGEDAKAAFLGRVGGSYRSNSIPVAPDNIPKDSLQKDSIQPIIPKNEGDKKINNITPEKIEEKKDINTPPKDGTTPQLEVPKNEGNKTEEIVTPKEGETPPVETPKEEIKNETISPQDGSTQPEPPKKKGKKKNK